jgi:hypothetical protein
MPQVLDRVSEQYAETYRIFVADEDEMRKEWNVTVEGLKSIDPTNPSDLVSGHSGVMNLLAILFPATAINGKQIEF